MKFDIFGDEHRQFRSQLKKFFSQRVAPYADEWDEKREIPRSIWRELGQMGFLGFCYEPQYGGVGADELFRIVMAEELARCGNTAFGLAVAVHNDMATTYINLLGSDEQKKRWLIPASKGEAVCAIAVTEPGAGSDVAAISTKADKKGDHYILNGQKTFITNGYYGDLYITAVKTDAQIQPAYKGISLIAVERNTPGVVAKKLKKVGAHSTDTAEIFFEDAEVPVGNLLGGEGQGFYALMKNFQLERLIAGFIFVETAHYILEKTLEYTQQRVAFSKPLSKFQVVKHKLVDMAVQVELHRCLAYECAIRYARGEDVTKEISMLKAASGEMVNRVSYDATQLHGGYGFMEEYEVAKLYRDLRAVTIAGGSTEVMKELIGRLMGL